MLYYHFSWKWKKEMLSRYIKNKLEEGDPGMYLYLILFNPLKLNLFKYNNYRVMRY